MADKWQKIALDGNYDYDDQALKENWDRLHLCDHEPFPSPEYVKSLCEQYPGVKGSIPNFDGDYEALSRASLEAWRKFHRGDFEGAKDDGLALGYLGYLVANMSTCVYASNIEAPEKVLKTLYWDSAGRSLEASKIMLNHTNSMYHYGLNLGRYSETISLIRAAAENIGGKFSKALHKTLDQDPDHVLANIGLGTYHCSIIDVVGSMAGKLTYGVSKDEALVHFERGLKVAPQLPVVYIEYGKGIAIIQGKKGRKKAEDMFEKAAGLTPMDALEELDIRHCAKGFNA